MVNAIDTLPSPQGHGLGFNYAVWTAGTQVNLCNVPWNSDYRDVVRFANQGALDTYLLNQNGGITSIGRTYAKATQPVKLSLPFDAVYRYNYLRVYNPAQPVPGDTARAFYYFITDVQYIAPMTTQVTVQLDVFQTFGYDVTFGNCYIERGHIGIANQNNFDDHGRTYLTVPEGIDVGGEYSVVRRWSQTMASARTLDGTGYPTYDIVVYSSVSLLDDHGTGKNPNLTTSQGSQWENLPNGAEVYIFTPQQFASFCIAVRQTPWVGQGILSIQAIPPHSRYSGANSNYVAQTLNFNITQPNGTVVVNSVQCLTPRYGAPLYDARFSMALGWRNSILADSVTIPSRYAGLKKFMTYPYCVAEVTAYTGTPVVLKPESWNDDDGTIIEKAHLAQPGPRVAIIPHRYNAVSQQTEDTDDYGTLNDGGEWLNVATGIFNFPSFSLMTNQYLEYMAANAHGIAFQFQNADWSQQKSLASNANSYDIANRGIGVSRELNDISTGAQAAQTALANQVGTTRAGVGAIMGVGGAALDVAAGGPFGAAQAAGAAMGAAQNVVGNAIDVAGRNASTAISIGASRAATGASTGQSQYAANSNNSLANWAARGDYQNEIAGINAKLQDAKLTQPSASGQVGGDAFNLVAHRMGYDLKIRMISKGVMTMIGEYWLRYGYAVQRFGVMPSSLQVMTKFTYWKLKETYITSSTCPEMYKQTLRGIFEKGVTVWANPADIGTIDIGTNQPLAGVTL